MKGYLVGFRKFAMAAIFLLVSIVLLIMGEVPNQDWMKHVSSVMIAFMATNVGEHIIKVGKEWISEKSKK